MKYSAFHKIYYSCHTLIYRTNTKICRTRQRYNKICNHALSFGSKKKIYL